MNDKFELLRRRVTPETEHPTIEVRFMGRGEKGNRYAVFVNGKERQPWTGKREAEREAKALREMCAAPL